MADAHTLIDLSENPPIWLTYPQTEKLFVALSREGGRARFVGGCVRDALMGGVSDDLDICTNLVPEKVMQVLGNAGFRVIPTGLKHGTVTALMDGIKFELTTLRIDVETFGRHADVSFTENFKEDAARRDFTFNALAVDETGQLFDYFGGLKDLELGLVRFIGNASTRIEEDRLRVLRYFRFYGRFGAGAGDAQALEACTKAASKLGELSKERITSEMMQILASADPVKALSLMSDAGVLLELIAGDASLARLERLLSLPPESDAVLRLAALYGADPKWAADLPNYMRLPAKTEERLLNLSHIALPALTNSHEQHLAVYQLGKDVFMDRLMLDWAEDLSNSKWAKIWDEVDRWTVPKMPVQGRDLIACGFKGGPELGVVLVRLEEKWVESDFTLTQAELLVGLSS
jgi:poly(A) polymerase